MEPVSESFSFYLHRLRILRELRDRGTIAAVADAMHLTPSAVSQQIARMSRQLGGVPLVVRHGRRVRLTPQADVLLEHATVIHRQIERARAHLAAHDQGQAGRVAIGGFASAIAGLVAPAVADLARDHPEIVITVREAEPPESLTRLEQGDFDIVITADHRGGPSRTDARYDRVDLLFDPLVLALPANHPLTSYDAIDLGLLAEAPWVLGADSGPCADAGYNACGMAGFTPDVRHRVNEWAAALAMVAAAAGVALVPRLALGIPPAEVAIRPLARPAAGRTLYAALRGGSGETPVYQTVLDELLAQAGVFSAGHDYAPR